MTWIELTCASLVCIYKCLNIANRSHCLYSNIVGDLSSLSLKFTTQNRIIYVPGMEGNTRSAGDDLENSGTSQDDGNPVLMFS